MQKIKAAIKKIPGLATAYRNVRDRWISNKKAVTTPFGYKFIGSKVMQSGNFEQGDAEIFRKLMADVDVVVDVGAHVGYYCLQALSFGKHLIAFEPFPLNVKTLLKNISVNGWNKNAEIFQMALAEKNDVAEMYGGGTGASLIKGWAGFSAKNSILVPVSSLDIVLGNRLAGSKVLVLIDVEGAEYRLLQGAKNLLDSEPKPIWIVEIVLSWHQPKDQMANANQNFISTFELFWQRGYDAYARGKNNKIELLEEKSLRASPDAALQNVFSNFFFVHKTSEKLKKDLLSL